jgi:hypothetical protein
LKSFVAAVLAKLSPGNDKKLKGLCEAAIARSLKNEVSDRKALSDSEQKVYTSPHPYRSRIAQT